MAYYFWHGLDFQGSRVSGAFKVPKRIDAIKKLRKKGIFRSRPHEISPYRLKSPVPLTQLVSILIQLERLQKSGFTLNRSLQFIVSETSDPPLAYALCKIRQDLQQGHSFSQAWLSQTALPEMVGRMLGVFESSGKLKEGLGHLMKFYESELHLRNEQIKLIHYPTVLGLFFLVLGSGLLLFVIPMFKSLYHRLGPELFWLTRMLVKFSDSLLEQPLIWLSAMLLTGTGLIFFSGVLAALKRNTMLDFIPMAIAMIGICVPTFLMGPLLVLIFGINLEAVSYTHLTLPTKRIV